MKPMSRKQIYNKIFKSDIFNLDPSLSNQIPKVRTRVSQTDLVKTKDDIFNTEKNVPSNNLTKKGVKHFNVYSKIFGSDIFCRTNRNPKETGKKIGVKKIRNANNFSSCFDCMKNLEEYKTNLKKYTTERRKEKKVFTPDKYLNNETAAERYYKEMYEDNKENIILERCFSAGRINKEKYAERKKNLNNEIQKLNDEVSDIKNNAPEVKKIYVRKKNKWTDKNSGDYNFIQTETNPVNNAKINKQIYLQSNIFKDPKDKVNKNITQDLNKINTRIEEEKTRINRNNNYNLSLHRKKRDLTGNDRMLYGAVHSKWEKSKLDWLNPQTELIFGTQAIKDVKNQFGPGGPTPIQRKLIQLADTKDIDTINEEKKYPTNMLKRPLSEKNINDIGIQKMDKALKDISNLTTDKKYKIKIDSTTSLFTSENDIDNKLKTLKNFYTSTNFYNLNKKGKKEITDKIGNKNKINNNKREIEEKCGHDFTEYVITYDTKGNFEKYGEKELKKLFEKNGVHIYDVHKNMFDKGNFNKIKFKVRNNEETQEGLKKKINNIEKNLRKNNKIKINKEKKKNNKLNSKNFVSNPGAKLGILNENIGNYDNAKFTKIPDNIKNKKNFSKQYENINYKYKQNF